MREQNDCFDVKHTWVILCRGNYRERHTWSERELSSAATQYRHRNLLIYTCYGNQRAVASLLTHGERTE
jgi:hypothetical protein